MRTFQVIKKPLVTEKGAKAQEASNQYYFEVDSLATKYDISNAIKEIFKVKVEAVRTMNMPAKFKRVGKSMGRTSNWKKAVVTLKEGEKIDFLEGA